MLYAKVLRPPAHGAKLKSVDTSKAGALDGVHVVEEGDFIAVLHEAPDPAHEALEAVRAEFDIPAAIVDHSNIHEHFMRLDPDPVEFRLRHLEDPRMIRVLKAAAEKFGWTPARLPSRRGLGVACGIDAGSYVAVIAEVGVDARSGTVDVKRVCCTQEMGIVINPQGATIQMEGCITMGLGYALTEEVHFKGGDVLDRNLNRYQVPRISSLPRIETHIVEADEIPPARWRRARHHRDGRGHRQRHPRRDRRARPAVAHEAGARESCTGEGVATGANRRTNSA
jgi:CO/xanthine dehydrogenase Mo-binding subunit